MINEELFKGNTRAFFIFDSLEHMDNLNSVQQPSWKSTVSIFCTSRYIPLYLLCLLDKQRLCNINFQKRKQLETVCQNQARDRWVSVSFNNEIKRTKQTRLFVTCIVEVSLCRIKWNNFIFITWTYETGWRAYKYPIIVSNYLQTWTQGNKRYLESHIWLICQRVLSCLIMILAWTSAIFSF